MGKSETEKARTKANELLAKIRDYAYADEEDMVDYIIHTYASPEQARDIMEKMVIHFDLEEQIPLTAEGEDA